MKARLIYAICIIVILQLTVVSQTQEWAVRYLRSGTFSSEILRTEIDKQGNIYSLSSTQVVSTGFDITLTKYNQSGVLQWAKHFNDSLYGIETPTALAVDDSGNVYAGGTKETVEGYDMILLKYKTDGSRQWAIIYNDDPANYHTPIDIKINKLGYIFVRDWGFSEDLYKFNAAGTMIWKKFTPAFPGVNTYAYYLDYIKCDRAGNIFIAAEKYDTDSLKVCKYSDAGVILSSGIYKAPAGWKPHYQNIAIDSLDNIYVACYIDSGTVNRTVIIKFDNNCVMKWSKRYNTGTSNIPYSIGIDMFRNVFIAGEYPGPSSLWNFVAAYDSNGTFLWEKNLNTCSEFSGFPAGLAIDKENNVFFCGPEYAAGTFDVSVRKYNIAGTMTWQALYNGTGNNIDAANDIKTYNNNIYVSGFTIDSIYKYGLVIKYNQPLTSINITNSNHPTEFSLSQNYPNPFNPVTNIKYGLPSDANVSFKVYDIMGKEVYMVNEFKKTDSNEVQFDGSDLASGMYFYSFKAETSQRDVFTVTKKMVLMK